MIPGIHDLALFAGAALLVNLTPGPDMLFVIGSSAARGRRAGVLAALGVALGCLLHIALAAFGLAALLAAAPVAFTLVKWLGAAYLVWIGIAMLRSRAAADADTEASRPVAPAAGTRVFWQGALTNALNPKVALFFLAFLPQFIEPGTGQALAFLALGMLFNAGGLVVNVVVALAAGTLAAHVARRREGRVGRGPTTPWLQRAAGALFVALGVKLALGSR